MNERIMEIRCQDIFFFLHVLSAAVHVLVHGLVYEYVNENVNMTFTAESRCRNTETGDY